MENKEQRQQKYTNEYYHKLKKKLKVVWGKVPFVCHNCGNVFYRDRVKPRTLPVNCSSKCRDEAFDSSIGALSPTYIESADWGKIRRMIGAGKTAPEISNYFEISLSTLHKHVKKKLGIEVYNRMLSSGVKRRQRAHKEYYENR